MKFRMSAKDIKKSYAVDEEMSGQWRERWSGFSSVKKAKDFIRRMESQCYGALRVVRVLREPLKE